MEIGTAQFRFMLDGGVLQLKGTIGGTAAADTVQDHTEQYENCFDQPVFHIPFSFGP